MNASSSTSPKPPRPKPTRLLTVLVIPVLIAIVTIVLGRSTILYSAKTAVYRFNNGAWSATDALPGTAEDIQVSPQGVVWVSTSFHAGLSKTNAGHWTSYNGSDFGTATNYPWGGFTLSGEDVWAATQEGVVRYSGDRWRLYKDALATDKPASIVATGSRVWVIDQDANLSSFDGSHWSIRNLKKDMPGVSWTQDVSYRRPALAVGADGRLWLLWKGLWRLDDGRWGEILVDGRPRRYAEFAGHTSDAIWIADGSELIALNAAGEVVSRLTKTAIGMTAAGTIYRVSSNPASLWVATSEGLFERDSRSWRKIPPPASGVISIECLVVAPDSSVWVIGALPTRTGRLGPIFGMIAIALAGLVFTTRSVVKYAKGATDRGAAVRETVQRSAGALPESDQPILTREELEKQTSPARISLTFLLILLVPALIAVASLFLLRRFWPDAPQWILPVGIAMIGLIIGLLITYRRAKQSGQSTRAGRRILTALLTCAAFYLLDFLMRQAPRWVPGRHGWWWEIIAIIAVGLLAAVLIPVVGDILPMLWANRALRRGDYAAALRRIDLFLRLRPRSAGLLYSQGTIQWLAGRQKEAEEALRGALSSGQQHADGTQALHLENLAYVLMEQGRYREALQSLEGSINILPDRGGSYLPLAETYLRQNSEPAKALAMADRAIELKEQSPIQKRSNRQAYADAWALRAWALAVLGRRGEASQSIEKALAESDRGDKPYFAGTLYHLGQALISQGDRSAAIEKFSEAKRVDPAGNYGSLAARALREHSVWGDRA